jgi:TRAP-type C4-dicarboxylate transport system permease large subunit
LPITPKGGAELYLEFSVRNVSVVSSTAASHRRRRLQSTASSTAASSSASLHGCGGAGGIGIMVQTLGMPAIARSRVVIGLIILIGVYAVIVTEILHRAVVGLIGALLVCGLLGLIGTPPTFNTVIDWMDEGTLGLLFGMMVIVAMLSTTGLFEWLAVKALKFSKGNILVLMVLLTVSVGFLSAFLDNVTTMLLFAPVTIKMCVALGIDPVPLLTAEVLFANLGGAATMIGGPPNIIIGLALKDHLGFADFIVNVAPIVLICYPIALVFTKVRDEWSPNGTIPSFSQYHLTYPLTAFPPHRLFPPSSCTGKSSPRRRRSATMASRASSLQSFTKSWRRSFRFGTCPSLSRRAR